ncbi:sensor histidine kinase [Amycolatopsis sp. NPDC058986]|uniref:sensor histidine kinase n=1 Tax=unclassified Amycolatopsis TaxID=2618356 RepID=UPI003670BF3E
MGERLSGHDGHWLWGQDRAALWQDSPLGKDEGPGKGRWPVIGLVFLLPFLAPVFSRVLDDPGPAWSKVVILVLAGAYGLSYLLFPLVFHRPLRDKLIFSAGMLVLGLVVMALVGFNAWLLIYATATLAFILPPAWALVLDGSTLVLALLEVVVAGRFGEHKGDLISIASITAGMFFMANMVRAIQRLQRANHEIATLAVVNERERVARDLHDLLGHSLTTITVKAGLARRVLESSGDIPRAVEEIREVEGLTRSALSDVRATVSEYREVSLSAELVGARAALRAAEIDADLPHAVDNVLPEYQNTFGYVLREAVTNVLRHSGAKKVKVRLGRNWLEVEDNGNATEVVAGNGLRGLAERLDAVGGTLRTSVKPGGGWVVRAEIPAATTETATPAVRAEPAGGLA